MWSTTLAVPLLLVISGVSESRPIAEERRQIVAGVKCEPGPTRIIDGDWHGNFFVSPSVSIQEAALIIHAIRHGDIDNKLPWSSDGPRAGIAPVMPYIDVRQIRSIEIARADSGERMFSLRTGCMSGNSYLVTIAGGTLHLRFVRQWIA